MSSKVSAETVCGTGESVKGVDVSYYQGDIDWAAVAGDGVEFAFVRVSDGLDVEDSKFQANWDGSRAAGIFHGAYQFFRPNEDPIAQADLLLSKIGTPGPDDLPPVIDVEAAGGLGPAAVAAKVRAWVDHVTAALGRAPIVYTGFYFWRDSVGAADVTTSPLWHAQYTSASCPNIAPPWQDWAFWQYTSTGRVAGISGNVDTNRFNGTHEQLVQFIAPRPCGTIPAAGGLIDDGDACFVTGGPQQYLRHVSNVGEGGTLIWTHATEDAAEANFAQWNINLEVGGAYTVEVATPAAFAQSKQARYRIHANGVDSEVVLDQSAVDGWQSLGAIDFAAGGDQFVHLADNTGEPLADQIQIVFDAIRLTPVVPPGGGDPGGDPGDPGSTEDPSKDGGCSAGGGGAGLGLGVGLVGLALRRRRRP